MENNYIEQAVKKAISHLYILPICATIGLWSQRVVSSVGKER